jgi:hypothetical protein
MSNKKIVFHFKVDYNDRERAKQCKLRWNPDIKTWYKEAKYENSDDEYLVADDITASLKLFNLTGVYINSERDTDVERKFKRTQHILRNKDDEYDEDL